MKRKRKKPSPQNPSNPLQIMLISLFIIMLTFFIFLNANSVINTEKVANVSKSLKKNFHMVHDKIEVVSNNDVNIGLESDAGMTYEAWSENKDMMSFSGLITDKTLSEELRFKSIQRGTVLSIPADILFEKRDLQIKKSGYRFLDRLVTIINGNEFPIDIVGHMDNIRNSDQSPVFNWKLSALRAEKILEYFLKKSNQPQNRFSAYGWGEAHPISSNEIKGGRDLNRRIDIIFVHPNIRIKHKRVINIGGFEFETNPD